MEEKYFNYNFHETVIHEIGHFMAEYIYLRSKSLPTKTKIEVYNTKEDWGGYNNASENTINRPPEVQIGVLFYGCIIQSIFDDSYYEDNKFWRCWEADCGGSLDFIEVNKMINRDEQKMEELSVLAKEHRGVLKTLFSRSQLSSILATDIYTEKEHSVEIKINELTIILESIILCITASTLQYYNSIKKVLED